MEIHKEDLQLWVLDAAMCVHLSARYRVLPHTENVDDSHHHILVVSQGENDLFFTLLGRLFAYHDFL